MNPQIYLAQLKGIVDKALDAYLRFGRKGSSTLIEAMRYSVFSGGKRLRPILVIESCWACGGTLKEALPTACAVEFIHTYSLIHDDLPAMDNDDYRRGKPACHKAFGEANAILAGDALLPLAFTIIAKGAKPAMGLELVRELSEAIGARGMALGQALDLEFQDKKKTAKMMQHINELKTSKLFEAAAKLGAIAAGSRRREIEAMARFGSAFGSAFQIADDIVDGEGYVRIASREKARRDSRQLIAQAKRALSPFGIRRERLSIIADYILMRKE